MRQWSFRHNELIKHCETSCPIVGVTRNIIRKSCVNLSKFESFDFWSSETWFWSGSCLRWCGRWCRLFGMTLYAHLGWYVRLLEDLEKPSVRVRRCSWARNSSETPNSNTGRPVHDSARVCAELARFLHGLCTDLQSTTRNVTSVTDLTTENIHQKKMKLYR